MPDTEIILRHVGGIRQAVTVIGAEGYKLRVTWPMCGAYNLDLKENHLIGKRVQVWSAVDIEHCRKIWRTMTNASSHIASLAKPRPTFYPYARKKQA